MNEVIKCQQYEYDGTLEGFEKLMQRMNLNIYNSNVRFLTKEYKETVMFTGIIELPNGSVLMEGDWYAVPIKEDNNIGE
jgi:hypothetical protein